MKFQHSLAEIGARQCRVISLERARKMGTNVCLLIARCIARLKRPRPLNRIEVRYFWQMALFARLGYRVKHHARGNRVFMVRDSVVAGPRETFIRLDYGFSKLRLTSRNENRALRRAMRKADKWIRTSPLARSHWIMRLDWIAGRRQLAAMQQDPTSKIVSLRAARERRAS